MLPVPANHLYLTPPSFLGSGSSLFPREPYGACLPLRPTRFGAVLSAIAFGLAAVAVAVIYGLFCAFNGMGV